MIQTSFLCQNSYPLPSSIIISSPRKISQDLNINFFPIFSVTVSILALVSQSGSQVYQLKPGWNLSPVFVQRRVIVVSPNAVPFDLVRDYFRPKRALGLFDVIPGLGGNEAYRLRRSTVIRTPASLPFTQGKPHQFSFECTFRSPREQPDEPYDLMKMTNAVNDEVASVNVDPQDKSLTCNLPANSGPQKIKFDNPPVKTHAMWQSSA